MQEERPLFGSLIFLLIAIGGLWFWVNILQETNSSPAPLAPVAQQDPIGTPIGADTPTPDNTPIPSETPVPTDTPDTPPTETPVPGTTPAVTPLGSTPIPSETPPPNVTPTPLEPTPFGPTETPISVPPDDACLRFNFDIGGDEAREGTFVAQEVGGRVLATWDAKDGWQDSGWIHDIEISHQAVYVDVYWVSPDGSERIKMKMLNPAPGTDHGWVARGMCHALEIEWP